MSWSEIENSYLNRLASADFPDMPPAEQPAAAPAQGTGSISAIPQTPKEKVLENVGITLERAGQLVDEYAPGTLNSLTGKKIPIIGELRLRDLIPLIGGTEQRENPLTGEIETKEVGTPQALQMAGRGESLTTGRGFTTQMKPDVKLAAADIGFTVAPLVKPAVKATGRAIQQIAETPPVGAINLSGFNPKKEIKSAIDSMATNPETAIYVPNANRAPSVALSVTKPEIIGTGQKGIITVSDAGKILEQTQIAFNQGKVLDPTNSKDLTKMIDSASAEAEFQLSQPVSGATWYDDDVSTAFRLSSKIVPQLATDEPLRVLTTAFAASTSYNTRAGANWGIATRISDHLVKTGTVAARNPDNGKLWSGTTGPIMEQQLKLHEYMINKMGLDGYSEWLLSPHTVKEIVAMRAESGLYKTPGIPGKATDMKMGAFIMGEKGGAFFLNLNGIKETTADKWFTRTYNRHTGTLTSGPVSEQGLVDAPRNEAERAIMKSWNRAVAQNVNLDEQANQAVLWYFEQNLYYNLGVKSAKSESFSDGARNLLNARGIAIDDAVGAAAAGGSNARQARTKPTSTPATGNPIGSGSATPNETTVTGGQAPAMGAE